MIEVIESPARDVRELSENELRRELRAACTAVGLGAERDHLRDLIAEVQRRRSEGAQLKRMWINQPSSLQPDHELHGVRVLAKESQFGSRWRVAYFLSGDVVSREIAALSLSDGWPESSRTR